MTTDQTNQPCGKCVDYLLSLGPHFRGACASVGIEHQKSTDQMMQEFAQDYHNREHQRAV